jgi:hypothetical protein
MTTEIPPPDPRLNGKVHIKQVQEMRDRNNNRAPHERTFTAAALQTMTFPALKFILPSLVPEGATLLVSRPKLGKSWLVLDIAIAIAAGRFTLGELKPVPGDVLHLALEDGRRRLQRRITKLLPTFLGSWPAGMEIATEWPRADQGGLDEIEQWLVKAKSPHLVVIDTLAQFRRLPSTNKQPGYLDDYAAISGLQKLANKYNVGIIIVHHDRKAEADDVFDTVSGTLGLTGAADTILIMKRQTGGVTLHVRGRDVEEAELALQFNKETCRWTILGTATDIHRSAERKRILDVLKDADTPLQAKDIHIMAGLRTRNATDVLLGKMVRDVEIVRAERGRYALPETDRQIAGQIRGGVSPKARKDRTDGQIAPEATDLKEEIETGNLSTDLSTHLSGAVDGPNLSGLSDLSGDTRGTPQTQLATGATLATAMPVAPGKSNGRAPALGPPGDSLDDLQ